MFKFVVPNPALARRLISTPLVGKFFSFDISSLDGVREQALRDEIFSTFSTECRHGKATAAGRFSSLDRLARELLPPGRHSVHDVAVSSGITSCELFEALGPERIESFCLSDKYARYRMHGRWVRRLVGADGTLLRAHVLGVLADPYAGRFFPGSRLLYRAVSHLAIPAQPVQDLLLLDPRTKEYLADGRMRFLDYDVLSEQTEPAAGRFSFVRCMNLLNVSSWFSEEQLLLGLRKLESSLKDSGVLQLGRTWGDGRSEVSYFQKRGPGMEEIRAVNGGTELRPLITRALRWPLT